MDSNYAYYSDHSSAVARSKVLDLLSAWATDGRKVLPLVPNEDERDMSSEFVTSVGKEQSCDMPRRVLFWEDVRLLSLSLTAMVSPRTVGPGLIGFMKLCLRSKKLPLCPMAEFERTSIMGMCLLGPLFRTFDQLST